MFLLWRDQSEAVATCWILGGCGCFRSDPSLPLRRLSSPISGCAATKESFLIKKFACFLFVSTLVFSDTWSGKLVDAFCKVSNEGADCAATSATHLFAIELPDAKLLNLNAAGNGKASDAVKDIQKKGVNAKVTGSLDGQTIKVESIEVH
jgi:hypothetical protein